MTTELIPAAVRDHAWQLNHDLIKLLLTDDAIKATFFDEIEGHWVFDHNTFIDYITDKRFTAKFKAEVVLEALHGESSQAELCRRHNLSENQVSTWKRQLLENVETFFESADKQSSESAERIVQLEQLVGRLTLALEIQKKAIDVVGLTPSQQRRIVETLRKEYSMRQICETLGFNKSTFYYQPKIDTSEDVLRTEIQQLAAAYPTYGYRRIRALLLRQGYTVGYKRVIPVDERRESLGIGETCLSNHKIL